jgi:hypothetical protein
MFIMTTSHLRGVVKWWVDQRLKDHFCPHQGTDCFQILSTSCMTWTVFRVNHFCDGEDWDALWNIGLPTLWGCYPEDILLNLVVIKASNYISHLVQKLKWGHRHRQHGNLNSPFFPLREGKWGKRHIRIRGTVTLIWLSTLFDAV